MIVFFLIMALLIPGTMAGIGLLWRNRPPKTINWAYGYRTSWSMKNKETWDYAHKFIARLWVYMGVALTVISFIILLIFWNSSIDMQGIIVIMLTVVQVVCMFLSIIPVEIALRRNFDKYGKRKR